jgi:tRNA nucleotidyltransferase (CCA-adding enzyme)
MMIEVLPKDLKEFLGEIESLGFRLTLVGGIPRDFFYFKKLGDDLDFEIRASVSVEKTQWPLYYQKLHLFLKQKGIAYTELPYLITRFDFGEFKLEFSSPRTEVNKEDDHTHHHFEANLDSHLDFKSAFKRRDFTINAIGITFNFKTNHDELNDPYQGKKDLEGGVLRQVSDDFFHDAVRFLRLVRFQIKFEQFSIADELEKRLGEFTLTKLSHHHFTSELFKSNPGKFLNLFSALVKLHKMELAPDFKIWTEFQFPTDLKTKEDILAFVYQTDPSKAADVSQFFSMPDKKLRDLKSFVQSYETVKKVTRDDLVAIMKMEESTALAQPLLKDLKNLEEKKEWKEALRIDETELYIRWSDWENIRTVSSELESISAPLRSYYTYLKAILAKLKAK